MPIESTHPPITVPPVDVYTFLFDRSDREFPDDHGELSKIAIAAVSLTTLAQPSSWT